MGFTKSIKGKSSVINGSKSRTKVDRRSKGYVVEGMTLAAKVTDAREAVAYYADEVAIATRREATNPWGEDEIECPECRKVFSDNDYDTGKGDGCHCHSVESLEAIAHREGQ